ncbi:oligosaccharide flippase family protein [Actinoplanes sp. TFC3]|uniref:oligosaccharide flippase family protein n=1 Tax=Actinoplanes sp. TFC3 TaxID=1710355 RepID=UPI000AA2187F|nr:oligosaccharide flippase family protein [Actinoplanes sp. TFC3]
MTSAELLEAPAAPAAARAGGAGWLMLATTGSGVINYGYALILTHGLPPAQYTAFAAGQALLMVRAAISGAGIPWILAREIGRAPGDHERHAVATTFAFWANLALGVLLTLAVAGGVLIFGTLQDAAVVATASLIMSVGSTGTGFLQGIGRMEAIAVLFTLEAIVKAGVGAGLVFCTGLGAAGALAGFVAGSLVLLLPLPRYRHLLRRPSWRPAEAALLRAAIRQTKLQAGVAITAAGDTVLVGVLGLGAVGGGPYQAASALGRVPLFASNAVATAAFPQISRDGSAARKAAALRSYLLVGIFMTAVMTTLPDTIRTLLFPETFSSVGRWLPCAAVLGLAIGLLNLCVSFLQADDRHGAGGCLLVLTAGYLAVVALSGTIFGVAGLAVGSATAALLAVAALAILPPVRPGWRHLPLRDLAAVVAVALLLAVVGNVVLWLAIVAVAGVAVLVAGFPEFAPRFGRR